jgi:hypothetical protein
MVGFHCVIVGALNPKLGANSRLATAMTLRDRLTRCRGAWGGVCSA